MSQDPCCSSARLESLERIYTYLDGELSSAEIREIKTHLSDCPQCEEEYAVEYLLKELVRRSCRDQAPQGLRERIQQRIVVEMQATVVVQRRT